MSAPVRWALAAVLTPGFVAGAWLLLAGRPLAGPGRGLPAAETLARIRCEEPRTVEPVAVLRTVRRPGDSRDRSGSGLGPYLVHSGRPREPLQPVNLDEDLRSPKTVSLPGETLGPQSVPAPDPEARSAARARVTGAAGPVLPAEFAPVRRVVPGWRERAANPSEATATPQVPPRIGDPAAAELPTPPGKPVDGNGEKVDPPPAGGRMPGPVVPLAAP